MLEASLGPSRSKSPAPILPDGTTQLCEDCQIFHSPHSLFGFEKQHRLDDVSGRSLGKEHLWTSKPTPVGQILQNKLCLACKAVGSAVIEKLQISVDNADDLSNTWIRRGYAYALPPTTATCRNYSWDSTWGSSWDASWEEQKSIIMACVKSGNPIRCVLHIDISDNPEKCGGWYDTPGTYVFEPPLGLQISFSYTDCPHRLSGLEPWDVRFLDTEMVRDWFSRCKTLHEDQAPPVRKPVPRGFRLIDMEEMRIVPYERSPTPFVALSYVWNHGSERILQLQQANVERLQERGGLDLEQIPHVIADAIRLCKNLCERYLWVDALCIVQDDEHSKAVQIQAMDTIYGQASWTLVAAVDFATAQGLPGVVGNPRDSFVNNTSRRLDPIYNRVSSNSAKSVERSAWNSRGWTFQERLISRKCLYITNWQVYFQCPFCSFQEDLDGSSVSDWNHAHSADCHPWIGKQRSMSEYTELIRAYTQRNLSFGTDILRAFAGVSNIMTHQMNTKDVFGLPERYFSMALLWTIDTAPALRLEVQEAPNLIPSWSWGAWHGDVIYHRHSPGHANPGWKATEHGSLVDYYFQDPTEGLRKLNVEMKWFSSHLALDTDLVYSSAYSDDSSDEYSDQFDSDDSDHEHSEEQVRPKIALKQKLSRSIPAWKACPQNPWEALSHSTLDPTACHIALELPGCLVFNTTTASCFLRPYYSKTVIVHKYWPSQELCITYERLYICDDDENIIGGLEMEAKWMDRTVDVAEKQDFVVLAAGKREEVGESTWTLQVMHVIRDGGVCQRLGLGYVETTLWKNVNPKWETVVLI